MSSIVAQKERYTTRVAVYLMGTRGSNVLLARRCNTGHMDGYWSLVAGHVDEGETCLQAMIREAREECNIHLQPQELTCSGVMHHYSRPYYYTNFIFSADITKHALKNCEPHKCESLAFYDTQNLPTPMMPYIREIITKSMGHNSCWVSEFGWE